MTWPTVWLKDLLAVPLSNGKSVPDHPGGFPVLRLTALRNGRIDLSQRKEGAWSDTEAERFLVDAGDFLVARGNGSLDLVGRGALVVTPPDPVAYPDTMIRVRPDTRMILPQFLALAWDSPQIRSQIEGMARTTTGIYKINQRHLDAVEIPLPPIDEQRRVVAVVDYNLSRLDATERNLGAGRRRLGQLEQAILAKCRDGASQPLADVTEIQGGIQKQSKRTPGDNAYPFLRVANVTATGLDLADVHSIELFNGELDRLRLQPGDLLVVEGNGSASQIGRAAMWDGSIDDCVHQNHLIRVRPRPGLLPTYLEAVWNSPQNRSRLTDVASSSSGLYTLSVSTLKSISIPVPSLARQEDLVTGVAEVREKKARLDGTLTQAETRRSALRRTLLSAAFSGRLTGNTPDQPNRMEMIGA